MVHCSAFRLELELHHTMLDSNQHFLVVTALGSDQGGILEAFTKVSKQSGCNIIESKLATLGEECTLLCHLAGTWNTIAKLEANLPLLAQQFKLSIQSKRTSPKGAFTALPYQIQIIGQDRPGILNEVSAYFSKEGILIEKMECETYLAKNQTPMTQITFLVNIPAKRLIASLRDEFLQYCEYRNLDVLMEPWGQK